MAFEVVFESAIFLKRLVSVLKELILDAAWNIEESKLTLESVDNSGIAYVQMILPAESFQAFVCKRPTVLCMNSNNLFKLLSCADDNDELTLQINDVGDRAIFLFKNKASSRSGVYQLKLLDLDVERLAIRNYPIDATVCVASLEFSRICSHLSQFGPSIDIRCDSSEMVTFSSDGDFGSGSLQLHDRPDIQQTVNFKNSVNVSLSSKFMFQFSKAGILASTVTIKLSRNDAPVIFSFKLPKGTLKFYLAQRIKSD